jgi:hypothetical protein
MPTAGAGVKMYGILTDARKAAFEAAMHAKKPIAWFHTVADAFEQYGLFVQAQLLRARAAAKGADKAKHDEWKEAIRLIMRKRDPDLAEKGADACEKLGMTVAAGKLRLFAQGLRDAASVVKS